MHVYSYVSGWQWKSVTDQKQALQTEILEKLELSKGANVLINV